MNDLNNGQTQRVLSDMLQHLQEATPDSDTAFTLREEVGEQSPNSTSVNGDVIELGGEFDYEGYQVVRREFFARSVLELLDLSRDLRGAVENVGVFEEVGFIGKDLLHAQRPLLVKGPRQAKRRRRLDGPRHGWLLGRALEVDEDGEGAGFAGGIVSAALDGLRVARAVRARLAGEAPPPSDARLVTAPEY